MLARNNGSAAAASDSGSDATGKEKEKSMEVWGRGDTEIPFIVASCNGRFSGNMWT